MASCDYCGTTIVFGGKSGDGMKFCSDRCRSVGTLVAASRRIPEDVVRRQTEAVFRSACPKCRGKGPMDVHVSHSVWSAILVTSWKSTPRICCRACGIKSQAVDALSSLLVGWWGLPWGFLMTPVQVVKNIFGMARAVDEAKPSPALEREVRLRLAAAMQQPR